MEVRVMNNSRIALLLMLAAAVPDRALSQSLSGPERNFEYVWDTFDRTYALFGPKHVDWQALKGLYRPRVTAATSDDELFAIMSAMLGHLNDNHVMLASTRPNRFFSAGILNQMLGDGGMDALRRLTSQRPVQERYFPGGLTLSEDGVYAHAWVTSEIGYIHFNLFRMDWRTATIIDGVLRVYAGAKGLIVDVRRNGGGDDRAGKIIADRFADQRRLYMTSEIRHGARHDQFTWKKYWHVEPAGPLQFTRTTILLVDRTSLSAAENFALAMRTLPHVTLVGDLTSGCFADQYGARLPNGWQVSVSYKLMRDHTGFCWEGIGVPPDLRQVNSDNDTYRGTDRPFELAVGLIESGALALQAEDGSLKAARRSLVAQLRIDIGQVGIAEALAAFDQMKASDPDGTYVDGDELLELAGELDRAGRRNEAGEVMALLAREFPDMPRIR
jgi:C-terminal processing protease CtpA/Prc